MNMPKKIKKKATKTKRKPKAKSMRLRQIPKSHKKAKPKKKTPKRAHVPRKTRQKKPLPDLSPKHLDWFLEDIAVPSNGTVTSDAAAASIAKDTSRLRRIVWRVIHERGGLTCDEVERITELKHQTASARIWELHTSGKLLDSGKKRKTRSDCYAIVWVVNPRFLT